MLNAHGSKKRTAAHSVGGSQMGPWVATQMPLSSLRQHGGCPGHQCTELLGPRPFILPCLTYG